MLEASALPHVIVAELAAMIAADRTALVVVDVQNDFAAPSGLIARHGADMVTVEPTIDRIETLIAAARDAGATVAFMRVVTRPESDPPALVTLMARRKTPGAEGICRAAGGGADYYRVTPQPGDIEIEKLLYSSFSGTDLDDQLKARQIDTLVMTGLTTECCVGATASDAFHHGYNVFVASDACSAYDSATHYAALAALEQNCALLVDSAAVAAAWR